MRKYKQADLIKQLSQSQLIFHVYLTQVILLLVAMILSFIFFNDVRAFFSLFKWDFKWILLGFINGCTVVFIDLLLMKKLPRKYYDDGGINEKIFSNLPTWKIFCLITTVAIAEEILFRGVLQTNFGIFIASFVFAVIHIRYWTHWFLLLNVIVLSFWIGLIYSLSGEQLLPVMAMHFTIDFLLGIYVSRQAFKKTTKERVI